MCVCVCVCMKHILDIAVLFEEYNIGRSGSTG